MLVVMRVIYTYDNYVKESSLNSVEFMDYLHRITQIVKEELAKIPYNSDRVTWTNIYISCMLTFINSITLSNKNKTKLYIKDNVIYSSDAFIDKLFREENKDPVLLFHLDPTMKDYILVLTNKIKKESFHRPLRYDKGLGAN